MKNKYFRVLALGLLTSTISSKLYFAYANTKEIGNYKEISYVQSVNILNKDSNSCKLTEIPSSIDINFNNIVKVGDAIPTTVAEVSVENSNTVSNTNSTKSVKKSKKKKKSASIESGSDYSGGKLTKGKGVNNGPSGKETYYNLDMSGVISIMRSLGYSEDEYPYWIRDDGVKMFGPYVMVAAELSSRPKGTIIECSLGTAIVVDTGGFAANNPTQLDIAVDW